MGRKKSVTGEEILDAINRWLIGTGSPPTVEELRKALRVGSTRTVQRHLDRLEEEGQIERWPGARGLRPLRGPQKGLETRTVPLVGEAPAGPLMLAEENHQGWVRLPKEFVRPPSAAFFLLRVRGDSMDQARVEGGTINNGDLVLVRQQPAGEAREIVVALIDGEATIKRFAKGPGYFILKPESSNKDHSPIIVGRDFQIQGVVARVLKKGSELLAVEE